MFLLTHHLRCHGAHDANVPIGDAGEHAPEHQGGDGGAEAETKVGDDGEDKAHDNGGFATPAVGDGGPWDGGGKLGECKQGDEEAGLARDGDGRGGIDGLQRADQVVDVGQEAGVGERF